MTHPGAVAPTILPLIAAAAMHNAERRIHHDLLDAHATSEHTAIPLDYSGLRRRRLERLVEAGVIGVGDDNRYYLHPDRWEQHRTSLHRRALIALAVVLALFGLVYAASAFRH